MIKHIFCVFHNFEPFAKYREEGATDFIDTLYTRIYHIIIRNAVFHRMSMLYDITITNRSVQRERPKATEQPNEEIERYDLATIINASYGVLQRRACVIHEMGSRIKHRAHHKSRAIIVSVFSQGPRGSAGNESRGQYNACMREHCNARCKNTAHRKRTRVQALSFAVVSAGNK